MQSNYKVIENLLKSDSRLVAKDGSLLKNKIFELINKMDSDLLKILLSDERTEQMFFVDVEGMKVFDKNKFSWLVDSSDFVPDSYTAFANDIILVDEYRNAIRNTSDVVLEFPYKDCVLEMDSTDDEDERNEVFLNETIMRQEIDVLEKPKAFKNAKLVNERGSQDISVFEEGNFIIKGNNLLALHSLVPKYKGQIKLMYWDILYNTDSDQVPYNDSFKHSSWLVMMKNRLEVAKTLLRDNGIICLQCDDNEQAYLKVLCDEIFGRDKFVNCVVIKSSEASGIKMSHAEKKLPKLKDYLLIYRKGDIKLNPLRVKKETWDDEYKTQIVGLTKEEIVFIKSVIENEERSEEDCVKVQNLLDKASYTSLSEIYTELGLTKKEEKEKYNYENAYRIFQTASMSSGITDALNTIRSERKNNVFFHYITPKKKMYIIKGDYDLSKKKPRVQVLFAEDYLSYNPCDLWIDIKTTGLDNEGVVDLKNGKKPEMLLKRIMELIMNEGDIVLDAYLGSGTTAAVAHKLGYAYIGIEQLNRHIEKAILRLTEVVKGEQSGISKEVNWNGGGEFSYFELADYSQSYIDRINASTSSDELMKIYNEIRTSDFVLYRVDINRMEAEKDRFLNLFIDDKKKFLLSIIDKNTLYINYSDIDNADYELSDADRRFTKSFYEEV